MALSAASLSMKTSSIQISVCLALFLSFGTLHASARTWTDTNGRTLEASRVSLVSNVAVVERDGKELKLILAGLSEDDRRLKWFAESRDQPWMPTDL
jgi:hypothetical protein